MADELSVALDLASELALAAGELLISRRAEARSTVTTKANANDFVTAADIAAEELIVNGLAEARPADSILGEERTSKTGTNEYRWVIDPLDGTRNYVAGCGPFAVSIGLELHGRPILGVIRDPLNNLTLSAINDRGAMCNGEPMHASTRSHLNEALVGLSLLPGEEGRAQVLEVIQATITHIGDFRRLGSAVTQLGLVAQGALDATISMNVKRWDVCAGIVIASESGATVLGPMGGDPNEILTIAGAPEIVHEIYKHISIVL